MEFLCTVNFRPLGAFCNKRIYICNGLSKNVICNLVCRILTWSTYKYDKRPYIWHLNVLGLAFDIFSRIFLREMGVYEPKCNTQKS